MITIEQPAMALNDPRLTSRYQMWNTWNITAGETREHLLGWVAAVARGAQGGKLRHVVVNCHGSPSSLRLGQGFTRSHTALFARWAGLVEKIWFVACRVAFIQTPGAPVTGDGNLFCSEVARAAQCYVVASTETQIARRARVYPYGQIDTFEGLVLSYGPGGDVTWSRRYPSHWASKE